MAHDHGHSHPHHGPHGAGCHGAAGALRLGFVLTIGILAVEVVVAFMSHSLALLADAGHVLTDLFALGLSWFAVRQAERPADANRTYGYHRTGIMVALANASTLLLIAAYILHEAYTRFRVPVAVEGPLMLVAAAVALIVNGYVGWMLHHEQEDNLNLQSAFIHVVGDVLASVGVIVAAALIWWQPSWSWLDPAISVGISLLIAVGAWQILSDASTVLMEGVPKGIDVDRLVQRVSALPGVDGVHDLHVWCVAAGIPLLTCHVLLRETEVMPTAAVLNAVRDVLKAEFGIDHCTLQPEWELCGPDNLFCTMEGMSRAGQPEPLSPRGGAR